MHRIALPPSRREGRAAVPRLGLRRERALGALHQEGRLRRGLWRALRPPRRDAGGAHHQLDHLHQQGTRLPHLSTIHTVIRADLA